MNPSFFQQLHALLVSASLGLPDPRPRRRMVELGLALLCAPKPKTLTGALEWLGQTQTDWSTNYRLFSQDQWESRAPFLPVLTQALAHPACPWSRVYFGQDDTLLRKTSKKTPGVAYARDPLSPPFQVNLVLGQRFVQTSLLLQPGGGDHPWRALPVAFDHAPVLKLPKRASAQDQAAFKEVRKKHRLSVVALEQLHQCRQHLDGQPGGSQRLLMDVVDGGYTNRTFFVGLPPRTEVVGRIRKDAKFRAFLPHCQRQGARKYGAQLPTPLAYLQEANRPWQSGPVFVAGTVRTLQFKEVTPLCWPKVTRDRQMRLILIKAPGYRLRKGSKLLYREPAFLITTDLTTPALELIAAYLARWEVEVNFRDEKTILGVGQAQVTNPQSVRRAPAFLVACYSMLLWSSIRVFADRRTEAFATLPRWRGDQPLRPSTRDLIRLLQQQTSALMNQMRN